MSWTWGGTLRVLLVWSILALLLFVFRLPSTLEAPIDADEVAVLADIHIDAFVYIAMGSTAEGNNVDYSIATLRSIGRWKVPAFHPLSPCLPFLTSRAMSSY